MRLRLALLMMLSLAGAANAQAVRDSSAFADLRADGNGIGALQTRISTGFTRQTAKAALTIVATLARVSLSMDAELPALQRLVTAEGRERTAAVAFAEIANAAGVRLLVTARGQVVVAAGPAPRIIIDEPRRIVETKPRLDSAAAGAYGLPTVQVTGDRMERLAFERTPDASVISMSRDALASTPSFVEPDILRSIQQLPGIETRSDWSASFNVHGGEADQTLILLDGYPIYNPFHIGGLFSTFIESGVGSVELHNSALPARYGGRLSGVLDVTSALPTTSAIHGSGSISLISSSGSIGSTFDDGNGAWMVSARRSYADVVLNLIKPNLFPYHFQDLQARVTESLGHGIRFSSTAYAGYDVAAGNDENKGSGGWGNRVLGATLSKVIAAPPRVLGMSLGDSVRVEQRMSLTNASVRVDLINFASTALNTVSDLRSNSSLTIYGQRATTTIGYERAAQTLRYHANTPIVGVSDLVPVDSLDGDVHSSALFIDHVLHPNKAWLLDLGARLETNDISGGVTLSPRLSMKYFLSEDLALTVGGGRYNQWLHSLGREEEPLQPFQYWVSPETGTQNSQVDDITAGFERWTSPTQLLHVGSYYKRYESVLVPNIFSAPNVAGDEFTPATGASYGLDVLWRELGFRDFSGMVGYSYAFSTRTNVAGENYFPAQDRRHNLNAVGSWRAGQYTIGMHGNLASGIPSTPVIGQFARERYDPSTHRWLVDSRLQNITGSLNSDRTDYYQRFDVSFTRNGERFSPYLSVLNVLNNKNVAGYIYRFNGAGERADLPNIPIVPTFGLNFRF